MSRGRTLWLLGLCSISTVATASGQLRTDCQAPQPPAIGVAVGRSSPYLELSRDAVSFAPNASSSVRGGAQVAVRGDLPIAGPLRVRIEGAASHWDVRQKLYDPNAGYQEIADRSIASMSARDVIALVGITTGRAPVCAHVSAGGGLYSISLADAALHPAGVALSGGIEAPVGQHGAIQADATLHLVTIHGGAPITNMSATPMLSVLVGWAYRF